MDQPQTPVDSTQVVVVLANNGTDETVVWLGGEHDLSSVDATAAGAGRSDLVFDLSGVEFMDSTVIYQLVTACTRLGADGRMARVRDPSPAARYVLEICGLTHLVET